MMNMVSYGLQTASFNPCGAVSNASSLDNFHENLPFSISYEDLSLAQSFSATVLDNAQSSNDNVPRYHAQDSTVYQTLPTSYASFPISQAPQGSEQSFNRQFPHVSAKSSYSDPVAPMSQESMHVPKAGDLPTPVRVTRPPNAFLLFNKEMRKKLKDSNPTMKVAEISKAIGEKWKTLSDDAKNRYVAEANAIKEAQRALHPNVMYIRRSKAELARAGHYTRIRRRLAVQQDQADEQQQQFQQTGSQRQSQAPEQYSVSQTLSASDYGSVTGGSRQPAVGQDSPLAQRRRQRRDRNPAAPKHPLSAYMWFLSDVRQETMQAYPGSTVGQISKLCAERWNTMTAAERMPWYEKAQADKARYSREMQIQATRLDYPMGRGTRQKYRAAAAAAAAAASSVGAAAASSLGPSVSSPSSPSPQCMATSSSAAVRSAKRYHERQPIPNHPLQHQHFQHSEQDILQSQHPFSMTDVTTSILSASMPAVMANPDTMGPSSVQSPSTDMN